VHVVAMTLGSDWTLAGSIMTFAIPVGGFIVASTWLYFLYTRPHTVPGHRELAAAGAVGMGRHATGGGRHAAPPPPSGGQPSPPAQPPGGGTPGSGEGPGGYGNYGGTEGR
jgi:hypothetical protein